MSDSKELDSSESEDGVTKVPSSGTPSEVLDFMDCLRVRDLPAKLFAEVCQTKDILNFDPSSEVTMYRRWLCPEPESTVPPAVPKQKAPFSTPASLVHPAATALPKQSPAVSRPVVPQCRVQAPRTLAPALGRSYGHSTATGRNGTSYVAHPVYRVVHLQRPGTMLLPAQPQPLLQQPLLLPAQPQPQQPLLLPVQPLLQQRQRVQYVQQPSLPAQPPVQRAQPRTSMTAPRATQYLWHYRLLSQRPMWCLAGRHDKQSAIQSYEPWPPKQASNAMQGEEMLQYSACRVPWQKMLDIFMGAWFWDLWTFWNSIFQFALRENTHQTVGSGAVLVFLWRSPQPSVNDILVISGGAGGQKFQTGWYNYRKTVCGRVSASQVSSTKFTQLNLSRQFTQLNWLNSAQLSQN